jgi:hypothetical protein
MPGWLKRCDRILFASIVGFVCMGAAVVSQSLPAVPSPLAAVAVNPSAAAQTGVPQVEVNKPFSVAFTPSATPAPTGLALDYRVYVDGVPNTLTSPTLTAAGEVLFPVPAFTATGRHNFRIASVYRVTDPKLWTSCPTAGCPEAFAAPDPFAVDIIAAPLTPPPTPLAPGKIRIIIPASISDKGELLFDWDNVTIEYLPQPVAVK